MNTTIPMLLVTIVVTALAPLSAAQNPDHRKVASRKPLDVSVEGLREAPRGVPHDTARVGSFALRIGPATVLECARSIRDEANGECLKASSVPTSGALLPYPGINSVFTPPAVVSGGSANAAPGFAATVGGGAGNTAAGEAATVAGGGTNSAEGDESMVGGGFLNSATGSCATIGGGYRNRASTFYTTVGGGAYNTASRNYAAVGGGGGNTAYGVAATVGGGGVNTASSYFATVGGGSYNTASGSYATIPGGRRSSALGDFSFAAGRRAKAEHRGTFVWGDSFDADKPSSRADEFNVYASGGVRLFTNGAASTGVLLAPGGSTWTMVSDRAVKENVEPVDARAVLDKVAELPVATWNYKDQDDSIRHMGPMAQDFYAAFGLGLGERTIDTIDPNGVALAAIQGLNEVVRENERRLAEKDAQIEELRASIERLEARVSSVQ